HRGRAPILSASAPCPIGHEPSQQQPTNRPTPLLRSIPHFSPPAPKHPREPPLHRLAQIIKRRITHRHDHQCQNRRRRHPPDQRLAKRPIRNPLRRRVGKRQRQHPPNRRQRGHEDRPKPLHARL